MEKEQIIKKTDEILSTRLIDKLVEPISLSILIFILDLIKFGFNDISFSLATLLITTLVFLVIFLTLPTYYMTKYSIKKDKIDIYYRELFSKSDKVISLDKNRITDFKFNSPILPWQFHRLNICHKKGENSIDKVKFKVEKSNLLIEILSELKKTKHNNA